MDTIFIDGTPFFSVFHRDGGRIRSAGFFAFARCDRNGRHTVLHLELTDAINRRAEPGHPRWGWALTQGMNEILVHMAGAPAVVDGSNDPDRQASWHPEAQVQFGEADPLPVVLPTFATGR